MKINKAILTEYIDDNYDGKYRRMASDIGVSNTQLWRLLNDKADVGMSFYDRFAAYCTTKKLDISLFFEKNASQKQ